MMKRTLLSLLLVATTICCYAIDREHQLKIYNWADYIDEDLLTEFVDWYKAETGEEVEIIYQLFDVNEIMLSKIEKGHEDYDLVCPSDYIIERMLKADLLLPINKDFGSTPNYIGNVAPYMYELMGKIQGDGRNANDYAVPYMWGTVGLMYNTAHLTKEDVSTWNIMKDPRLKGKLLMKEAFRDVYTSLNIAFHEEEINNGTKTLDEVSNDTSDESIARVEAFLNEIKDNIAGWEVDFGKEMMTKDKAWLNLSWSGDAQWAIEEAAAVGVDLDYVVPTSGSTVWYDGWVIPKYARNTKAASYFINYMCMVENAIRNMDIVGYVSAIGGAEILEAQSDSSQYEAHDVSYFFGEQGKAAYVSEIMYPDIAVINKCGMLHDRGTEELLAMWSRIKGDNANFVTVIIIVVLIIVIVFAAFFSRKKRKHSKRSRR